MNDEPSQPAFLKPDEILLQGRWLVQNTSVIEDAACNRIHTLIGKHLQKLGADPSGWDTLYLDPRDDRLWEHTYPRSEVHGGGPPSLIWIPRDEAVSKYGPIVPPSPV